MRPIDAGYAMEAISRHRKPTPVGQYGAAYNDGINAAIQEILLAPTLTQPNEPLTLDELRQMDGHPVWVVERPDWGHWELSADAEDYIAERDQDFYGLKHNDPAGRYGLHMLGWLAYRRPPEEEDKHGDYHPVMNR